MRISVVQNCPTSDLAANLAALESFCKQARDEKAEWIVFPEMAYFAGSLPQWKEVTKEYSPIAQQFGSWAKKYGLYLCTGSLREPAPDGKAYNRLDLFSPEGKLLESYQKIFLFSARLPDRIYQESFDITPGSRVVCSKIGTTSVGFSICFDLRFPELFRALKRSGAEIVLLPSAFTAPTGAAHWEPLVRARAIENQFFIIAPDQTGKRGDGAETYGHSMVVDPWGEVLVDMGTQVGLRTIDVNLAALEDVRLRISLWENRRDDLFYM